MLQHVVGDHHIVAGVGQRHPGDVHLVGDPVLMQVGGLVQRVAAHQPHHDLLRREMQDAHAGELVAAAFGDPEPQQPVPLAAAAVEAAGVPARRMADADEHAGVAADRAGARQARLGELAAVVQPGRGEAAALRPGAVHGFSHPTIGKHGVMLHCGMNLRYQSPGAAAIGAGWVAAQCRAMSSRRVVHTPAKRPTWSSRRSRPTARAG